MELKQNKVW